MSVLSPLLITALTQVYASHVQREVGFLKDKRRLNGAQPKPVLLYVVLMGTWLYIVAMTRAKRHMVRS